MIRLIDSAKGHSVIQQLLLELNDNHQDPPNFSLFTIIMLSQSTGQSPHLRVTIRAMYSSGALAGARVYSKTTCNNRSRMRHA